MTGSRRVLLVEDEGHIRALIGRYLGKKGYDVAMAGNCSEAKALVEGAQSSFDIIICDYTLPDSTGNEIIAFLRPKFPNSRFLVISGYTRDYLDISEDSCIGFLEKPFSMEELVLKVREMCT